MRYVKRICERISDKLKRLMKENLRKAICGRFGALAAAHERTETDCAQISGEVTLNCVALSQHKRREGVELAFARGTHDLNEKTVSQHFSISIS